MKNVEAKKNKKSSATIEKTEKKVVTLSIEDLSKVNGGSGDARQQGLSVLQ